MALVEATVCRKLEGMYGSRAALLRKQRADDREVLIFALLDRPDACCFVWQDGGRVRTVLGGVLENEPPTDVQRVKSRSTIAPPPQPALRPTG